MAERILTVVTAVVVLVLVAGAGVLVFVALRSSADVGVSSDDDAGPVAVLQDGATADEAASGAT
ncbi:MAG: hypothetical protein AAGD35_19825, partial [Actinomycetota bacterium]